MEIWGIFNEVTVDGYYNECDLLSELHKQKDTATARCNMLNKNYPFTTYKIKKLEVFE